MVPRKRFPLFFVVVNGLREGRFSISHAFKVREKAEETGAHIIAMSTLMSTTMDGMKEVIDMLKKQGKRHKYKVMVGGGAISQAFANAIGADGYAPDANAAVRKAKELMEGYSYDL